MIKYISILSFRIFDNIDIHLGKRLTIISGRNATGKSNLLAMLGNSCQLSIRKHRTLLGNEYRSEFSEIFKGSNIFDKPGSNKYKVVFEETDVNGDNYYREFRVTWQDAGTRFRVIPKYEWVENGQKRKTEKKYDFPSLYLGLSRLYPIGESKDSKIKSSEFKLSEIESKEVTELYNRILEPENIERISFLEVEEKKSAGISTDTYDFNSNSAGQDNVMQILLSIISFKRLKSELNSSYRGGLLLIDEIDAALHPKAQLELLSILDEYSIDLSLQIVATSHSEKILKSISSKLGKISLRSQEDYKVVYLTKSNGYLECKDDNLDAMIHDLNSRSSVYKNEKITVYAEDDEARWLLGKLTKHLTHSMNLVQTKLGHGELLKLDHHDRKYFSSVLFVFDGDVEKKMLKKYHNGDGNKLVLPYNNSPEKVIYNYIKDLPRGHQTLGILWEDYSSTKEGIIQDCIDIDNRDQAKAWFNRHLQIFDEIEIVDYIIRENEQEFKRFEKDFIAKYNGLSEKLFMNKIRKKSQ